MSKPRPIAFRELRVLPDQGKPLVPMPASAAAKPRQGWYREAFAGAAQGTAQSGRGSKAAAQKPSQSHPQSPAQSHPQPEMDSTSPPAPPYALAPVDEDAGDEASPALLLLAESVVGQAGLRDADESRRRWQRLSELTPVEPPSPVAAIARSISQASALLDVCALVVELCGGEQPRLAGTWEATVPLAPQGLGGTLLWLRLSEEALALRFVCDEPRTLDMLRPRLDELRRQLLQQLAPPLDLSIDIELA